MNVHGGNNQMVMVVLGADQPQGQFRNLMVVDEDDDRDLLRLRVCRFFTDQAVADQVADGLATVGVVLGRDDLVKAVANSIPAARRKWRGGKAAKRIGTSPPTYGAVLAHIEQGIRQTTGLLVSE
jgi:hypothetical protein